jgi:ABC-type phosphonate transport system ATPase subunit
MGIYRKKCELPTAMQLTQEQQEIVDCDLKPGEILKIVAFAGTGKTTPR